MFAILNNSLLPKSFNNNNAKTAQKNPTKPQQISGELLSLIVEHADISKEIGGGLVSLSVSKSALKNSYIRNIFANHIDRVCNVIIIWSDINASVVSVIQPQNNDLYRIASYLN